jgi:TatD DNase family protein
LEIADACKLPVIIHVRDAYPDALDILTANKHYLRHGAVLHCYSGSLEYLRLFARFEEMYFSFGGAVTFPNAKKDDLVKNMPLNKLLLETDCPYMTPTPYRGQINYPKYVNLVYQKIQSWLPNENIEKLTTHNAITLFKLKI